MELSASGKGLVHCMDRAEAAAGLKYGDPRVANEMIHSNQLAAEAYVRGAMILNLPSTRYGPTAETAPSHSSAASSRAQTRRRGSLGAVHRPRVQRRASEHAKLLWQNQAQEQLQQQMLLQTQLQRVGTDAATA